MIKTPDLMACGGNRLALPAEPHDPLPSEAQAPASTLYRPLRSARSPCLPSRPWSLHACIPSPVSSSHTELILLSHMSRESTILSPETSRLHRARQHVSSRPVSCPWHGASPEQLKSMILALRRINKQDVKSAEWRIQETITPKHTTVTLVQCVREPWGPRPPTSG